MRARVGWNTVKESKRERVGKLILWMGQLALSDLDGYSAHAGRTCEVAAYTGSWALWNSSPLCHLEVVITTGWLQRKDSFL